MGGRYFLRECQSLDRAEGQAGASLTQRGRKGKEWMRTASASHPRSDHPILIPDVRSGKRTQRKVSQTIWCKKSQGEASHLDGRLDWGVSERELHNLVRGVFFTKLLLPQTPGKNKCPNPKRVNNDGVSINAEPTHCHCACMFSKHYSYFSF